MVHRRRWSDIATRLQSFFLFGAEQTARSRLQSMWSSRPCFIYKIKCHFNRHVVFSESLIDPLLIDQSKPARVTIEHRQRTLHTSTRIQTRSLPGNDLAKQSPSEISSRWAGQQCWDRLDVIVRDEVRDTRRINRKVITLFSSDNGQKDGESR